jgi:exoribonuclease-2
LYTVFDPAKEEIIKTSCAAERVPISANYSPEDFSSRADADAKAAFANLERFAAHLARREKNTEQMQKSGLAPSSGGGGGQPRREFKIKADAKSGEVVIVARRERPEEKVVARLMVYLNQTWGEMLAAAGIDALFRVRGRILASPPADEIQYAWCSSPLRRYADLFNQRRLLALTQGDKPPPKEAQLDQIARRFEKKHDKAKRFQADMERFWALRLAARNPQARHRAEKTAANRARLTDMPIGGEVAKLPRRLRPGAQFSARVAAVDLIKLRARLEWAQ